MRRIELKRWKERVPDGNGGTIEQDFGLTNAIVLLLNSMKPENMPRGFDKFRMYSKITKALEKAESGNVLELEDAEYVFLKKMVDTDIPAGWGSSANLAAAMEAFMEAKANER